MERLQCLFAIFWLLVLFLIPSNISFSAPLPKATQELLKKLNLDPSLLADIDKELQVPNGWIEQAKKNGKLRIRSTPARPGELKTLFGPFKERYPYIEIDFSGTNQQTRSVKTLIAYKRGRVLADFMTSIGGFLHEFKAADAPFRDQILGREEIFRNREYEMKVMPELSRFWNELWLRGGGAHRR